MQSSVLVYKRVPDTYSRGVTPATLRSSGSGTIARLSTTVHNVGPPHKRSPWLELHLVWITVKLFGKL